MTLELAIETSSRSASVAARSGDRILERRRARAPTPAIWSRPSTSSCASSAPRRASSPPSSSAWGRAATPACGWASPPPWGSRARPERRCGACAPSRCCSGSASRRARAAACCSTDAPAGSTTRATGARQDEIEELLAPAILPPQLARERAADDGRTLGDADVPRRARCSSRRRAPRALGADASGGRAAALPASVPGHRTLALSTLARETRARRARRPLDPRWRDR